MTAIPTTDLHPVTPARHILLAKIGRHLWWFLAVLAITLGWVARTFWRGTRTLTLLRADTPGDIACALLVFPIACLAALTAVFTVVMVFLAILTAAVHNPPSFDCLPSASHRAGAPCPTPSPTAARKALTAPTET